MTQVCEHQESTRRQYDMQVRARKLGWTDERIVVLDEDLGQSASDGHLVRIGFQKLLADVVVGRVGGIVSLEVSRLARQDSEGHRLVEVAALTGTLLIDEQQVYDPRLADDRLMLGLKVLLSSNELRQMSLRLWENRLRKAQRGELRINSRAEFEANQAQLERRKRRPPSTGRRRDGAALLSGIVLCGHCGRRMHVIYSGRERQQITYICNYRQRRYAQQVCQRVSGSWTERKDLLELLIADVTLTRQERDVLVQIRFQEAERKAAYEHLAKMKQR